MGRKFIIVIVLSLSLAACGASGTSANSTGSLSGGWLHSYSSAVEFFQLTVNGSQVSGQEQEEYATNETPPHLLQSSTTVSGTFNGTQVTLTFSIYGFPVRTYAGTYGSNALTLAVPDQSGNLLQKPHISNRLRLQLLQLLLTNSRNSPRISPILAELLVVSILMRTLALFYKAIAMIFIPCRQITRLSKMMLPEDALTTAR